MRTNTLKQQRANAELESIIEEFGCAMRNANFLYIAKPQVCSHDSAPRFTMSMDFAWSKYVDFCRRNPHGQ